MNIKNKHIVELLPDYLDNQLEARQKELVNAHLKECDSCTKELKAFTTLFNAIKKEEINTPSDSIKKNFYELLELEKQQSTNSISIGSSKSKTKRVWPYNFLKVAASIAIIIGSFLFGRYQRLPEPEVNNVVNQHIEQDANKKNMLALLENTSASSRIQGVNYISEFENPDKAIVEALVDRMLFDENTNVRLTAVEALKHLTASEVVKKSFIIALKIEKDPGIQMAIIHTLVRIQEKKAIAPMQQLLQQKDTEPFIKEQLESLLPNII